MSALLVAGSVSVSILFGLVLAKGIIALMLAVIPSVPGRPPAPETSA